MAIVDICGFDWFPAITDFPLYWSSMSTPYATYYTHLTTGSRNSSPCVKILGELSNVTDGSVAGNYQHAYPLLARTFTGQAEGSVAWWGKVGFNTVTPTGVDELLGVATLGKFGTPFLALLYNANDGKIGFYTQTSSGTPIDENAKVLATFLDDNWHHWEWTWISTGAGVYTVKLYIDEALVITKTSLDLANADISQVQFRTSRTADTGIYFDHTIDDVVVRNTSTAQGEHRVFTRVPNGDITTQMSPSVPSLHTTILANMPITVGNYVFPTASGHTELFDFTDAPPTITTVEGFKVSAIGGREETEGTTFECIVSSNDVVAAAGTTHVSTDPAKLYIEGVFNVDPNTSSAFTASAFNAMKVGFRSTTGNTSRVYDLFLESLVPDFDGTDNPSGDLTVFVPNTVSSALSAIFRYTTLS
jgi:hypothetical protein